jgi:hypothetical protein
MRLERENRQIKDHSSYWELNRFGAGEMVSNYLSSITHKT